MFELEVGGRIRKDFSIFLFSFLFLFLFFFFTPFIFLLIFSILFAIGEFYRMLASLVLLFSCFVILNSIVLSYVPTQFGFFIFLCLILRCSENLSGYRALVCFLCIMCRNPYVFKSYSVSIHTNPIRFIFIVIFFSSFSFYFIFYISIFLVSWVEFGSFFLLYNSFFFFFIAFKERHIDS